MKRVIIIVFLVAGIISAAYSQRTSFNNYTGAWEAAGSWTGGVAPPGTVNATHLDVTINGFITRTGNIIVSGATSAEDFIINDTLVILGDFTFNNTAAPLLIGPNAVLIVIGNVSFGNNTVVENDGIFVVSGNASFAPGASEVYDDSGGGELFVQGSVTQNPAASAADIWDQLDDLYPVIYDFVICGGGSSCILPVKLLYFNIHLRSEVIELKWATIMEENFQKFIVQRSANGIEFEQIGELPGKGFNIHDIESKYFFEDKAPLIGFNYYRLKAIDLDNTYEYFRVKVIKWSAPKSLSVFPNPSYGDFISFRTNFDPSEDDHIALINQFGVKIFRAPQSGNEKKIVFRNKLKPGIYLLKYVSKDFERVTKVIIKQ